MRGDEIRVAAAGRPRRRPRPGSYGWPSLGRWTRRPPPQPPRIFTRSPTYTLAGALEARMVRQSMAPPRDPDEERGPPVGV